MVSKSTLFILLLTLCTSLCGQSIKGKFLSKHQEDGVLFYLLEESLFVDENGDKLSHDLTYNSATDSMVMNFTFIHDVAILVDKMSLVSEDVNISGDLVRLYVEPKGKRWVHRYSLKSSAEPFFDLYNPESNPQITLSKGSTEYHFAAKKSAWKKYAPVGSRIFEVIELQNAD